MHNLLHIAIKKIMYADSPVSVISKISGKNKCTILLKWKLRNSLHHKTEHIKCRNLFLQISKLMCSSQNIAVAMGQCLKYSDYQLMYSTHNNDYMKSIFKQVTKTKGRLKHSTVKRSVLIYAPWYRNLGCQKLTTDKDKYTQNNIFPPIHCASTGQYLWAST